MLKDAEVRMTLGAIVGNLSVFVDPTLQPPISRVVTWSRKIWGCKFGVDFPFLEQSTDDIFLKISIICSFEFLIICSFEFFVEVCEGLMNYISAHPDEFKIKDRMTVGQGPVMYFSNFLNEKNAKAGAQARTIHILLSLIQ